MKSNKDKDLKMKDVMISIVGTQKFGDGSDDSVELITSGKYSFNGGTSKLIYSESELTGLEGTETTFTVEPFGITMERSGNVSSRMVFEEGKKHFFLYETPFGAATMGINTHKIKNRLSENGGDMEIDYALDFDSSFLGRNQFKIHVI